ncbi:arsenite efflux transporter metallochaperone ArsD [Bdellovibrionota bacterium FG-2]
MMLEVFDPPMCCSTGVCGSEVDPELVRFAGDLEWLKRQGVEIGRYNLSQNPEKFVNTVLVKNTLTQDGNRCLPLILVDGKIASTGKYLSREALAGIAGVEFQASIFTNSVRELVAIGAAIASNCEPCFKYHYSEARKLGVSKEDIRQSVDLANAVKNSPARAVLALAEKFLEEADTDKGGKCCG